MYILVNLDDNKGYICADDFWISILTIAQNNGWEPKGTRYDLIYEMDEMVDENDELLVSLYTIILINNRMQEWNGGYTEKENQIIRESDAENLYRALKTTGIDPGLISFLKKGGFRICSY